MPDGGKELWAEARAWGCEKTQGLLKKWRVEAQKLGTRARLDRQDV